MEEEVTYTSASPGGTSVPNHMKYGSGEQEEQNGVISSWTKHLIGGKKYILQCPETCFTHDAIKTYSSNSRGHKSNTKLISWH